MKHDVDGDLDGARLRGIEGGFGGGHFERRWRQRRLKHFRVMRLEDMRQDDAAGTDDESLILPYGGDE